MSARSFQQRGHAQAAHCEETTLLLHTRYGSHRRGATVEHVHIIGRKRKHGICVLRHPIADCQINSMYPAVRKIAKEMRVYHDGSGIVMFLCPWRCASQIFGDRTTCVDGKEAKFAIFVLVRPSKVELICIVYYTPSGSRMGAT